MKKLSTTTTIGEGKLEAGKLTVGLDLGDSSSFYCVLDETGILTRFYFRGFLEREFFNSHAWFQHLRRAGGGS